MQTSERESDRTLRGLGRRRNEEEEGRKGEKENERGAGRSRGRFRQGTRSSGARHEETEGDMECPATHPRQLANS